MPTLLQWGLNLENEFRKGKKAHIENLKSLNISTVNPEHHWSKPGSTFPNGEWSNSTWETNAQYPYVPANEGLWKNLTNWVLAATVKLKYTTQRKEST